MIDSPSLPGQPPLRGRYRKKDARAAAALMPCAWAVGDKESFYKARSRCIRAIVLDLTLSGREKAGLQIILDRMNHKERWSSFANIRTNATAANVSEATIWRAIGKADGKHILTMRAARPNSTAGYQSTHVTIHPNYIANLRTGLAEPPLKSATNNIANLKKQHRKSARRTLNTEPETIEPKTQTEESSTKERISDEPWRFTQKQEEDIGDIPF